MRSIPFQTHDAQFAIYYADAQGNIGALAWSGSCKESLAPEVRFEKLRVDAHGDPFGTILHIDEEHTIRLKNLWIMDRATGRMPQARRNQQHVLVIVWYDLETSAFVKRSYFGVTCDGQSLTEQDFVLYQDLPLNARHMTEVSGIGPQPNLNPVVTGYVRYVDAFGVLDIYSYEFSTDTLSPLVDDAELAVTARILGMGSNPRIVFAGADPAFQVGSVALVSELTSIGGTFPIGALTQPRVEFGSGPSRWASLTSAGELSVPDLEEADTPPVGGQYFRFFASAGGFALIAAKSYFSAIEEVAPDVEGDVFVSETGDTFVTEGGDTFVTEG